jgi:hypothetical protein
MYIPTGILIKIKTCNYTDKLRLEPEWTPEVWGVQNLPKTTDNAQHNVCSLVTSSGKEKRKGASGKHVTEVTFIINTLAILAGDGEGERQEEGTSSCIVPVLSRSNILVCSCDATFSVLTDRQTGPKFSSVPMRFRCSCKDINHTHGIVRVI